MMKVMEAEDDVQESFDEDRPREVAGRGWSVFFTDLMAVTASTTKIDVIAIQGVEEFPAPYESRRLSPTT